MILPSFNFGHDRIITLTTAMMITDGDDDNDGDTFIVRLKPIQHLLTCTYQYIYIKTVDFNMAGKFHEFMWPVHHSSNY